jgi:hypothetical protein
MDWATGRITASELYDLQPDSLETVKSARQRSIRPAHSKEHA